MEELKLAYIDPGSGSFLVQALVATAAGLAVAGRRYWTEIKAFLARLARAPRSPARASGDEGRDESGTGPSD